MTYPTGINTAALDLPAAITAAATEVSPTVTRVGVVTDIVEADNITVAISGSNVLVQASYLFPQYQPLLGDRVVVQKQDAQWLVLGTMSGPNNSVIENPSFDAGPDGSVPTGWTFTTTSAAGGTITAFANGSLVPVDGNLFCAISGSFTGAGSVSGVLRSTPVPAQPDESYTGAFYGLDSTVTGRAASAFLNIEWLDDASAVITTVSLAEYVARDDVMIWAYVRPDPSFVPTLRAQAPAGTVSVRLALSVSFPGTGTGGVANLFVDRMILRRVG
jgi:hypothetical protein